MTCPKCKDTGKIPLRRKDNSVVPYAWTFCPECYKEPQEHYYAPQVSDFDFAMSDSWRTYTYQYCGVPDPVYVAPQREIPKEPQELIISHRIIQDMALNALHKTLTRYIDEKLKEALKSRKDDKHTY